MNWAFGNVHKCHISTGSVAAGEGGVQRGPRGDLWPGSDDGEDWSRDDHGHPGHPGSPAHGRGQGAVKSLHP